MRRAAEGFTLIELLIVIGIISMLAVVLLPDLWNATKIAKIKDCEAQLLSLSSSISAYVNNPEFGVFPPDDLRDPKEPRLKPDNGLNTSSEALLWFLCNTRGGGDMAEHEGWLSNTDRDENGVPIPRLGRSQRMELTDPWGTPLAYFNARGTGYGRAQKIQPLGDGVPTIDAKAHKNAEGGFLGEGKYQIVSAGPDGVFNTDDDVTWPTRN